MLSQEKLARINELANKKKTEGLTEAETTYNERCNKGKKNLN